MRKGRLRQKEFKKDGWVIFGKKETVEKAEPSGLCDDFPVHGVGMGDSKFDILKKLVPSKFLLDVMKRREKDILN